jgi:hypothetical protein
VSDWLRRVISVADGPMLTAHDRRMENKKRVLLKPLKLEDLKKVSGGSPTLPLPPPREDLISPTGNSDGTGRA